MFLLLFLCLPLGAVAAYFTHQVTQENIVSVGKNDSEIEEEFPDPKVKEVVQKEVKIKNTGSVACFARVKVLWSDERVKEKSELEINEEEWEYDAESDYYYYKKVLEERGGSAVFMTKVKIKEPEQEGDFELMLYEETCQQGQFAQNQYKEAFLEYQKNKRRENIEQT